MMVSCGYTDDIVSTFPSQNCTGVSSYLQMIITTQSFTVAVYLLLVVILFADCYVCVHPSVSPDNYYTITPSIYVKLGDTVDCFI